MATPLGTRLDNLYETVRELMKIGGTAGLSLAVLNQGEPVFKNYGYSDIAAKTTPTEKTIYAGCSLTKALTSAAMAALVDEGKLTWDHTVEQAIPGFTMTLGHHKKLRIAHLLSHQTAMIRGDNLYTGARNTYRVTASTTEQYLRTRPLFTQPTATNPLQPQQPGEEFAYNNDGYEIAGLIIQTHTQTAFAEHIQRIILQPLHLQNTMIQAQTNDEHQQQPLPNLAKNYNTLCGTPREPIATAVEIGPIQAGKDIFGAASAGIFSCTSDLIALYTEFMRTYTDQMRTGRSWTEGSPLKQVASQLMAEIVEMVPDEVEEDGGNQAENETVASSINSTFYGFGWARTRLPSRLGRVGLNVRCDRPVLGREFGRASRRDGPVVMYHSGALCGALACVVLVPEMDIIVVVLTNSLALTDVADWVAQLVLEQLLGSEERADFLGLATKCVQKTRSFHEEVAREIESGLTCPELDPKNYRPFVGSYRDVSGLWAIVIECEETEVDTMNMFCTFDFPGPDKGRFKLTFLHPGHHDCGNSNRDGDDRSSHGKGYERSGGECDTSESPDVMTFSWYQTHDVLAKNGNWVDHPKWFYLLEFHHQGGDWVKIVWYWSNDERAPPMELIRERKEERVRENGDTTRKLPL